MNTAEMEKRIRDLEARRAKGQSVPELDALYKKMDTLTEQGYKAATGEVMPKPQKKAKGGYVSAADGCAKRGKTKGRIL